MEKKVSSRTGEEKDPSEHETYWTRKGIDIIYGDVNKYLESINASERYPFNLDNYPITQQRAMSDFHSSVITVVKQGSTKDRPIGRINVGQSLKYPSITIKGIAYSIGEVFGACVEKDYSLKQTGRKLVKYAEEKLKKFDIKIGYNMNPEDLPKIAKEYDYTHYQGIKNIPQQYAYELYHDFLSKDHDVFRNMSHNDFCKELETVLRSKDFNFLDFEKNVSLIIGKGSKNPLSDKAIHTALMQIDLNDQKTLSEIVDKREKLLPEILKECNIYFNINDKNINIDSITGRNDHLVNSYLELFGLQNGGNRQGRTIVINQVPYESPLPKKPTGNPTNGAFRQGI